MLIESFSPKATEATRQTEDLRLISQILGGSIDQPGSWAKKSRARKTERPLSCAEFLALRVLSQDGQTVSIPSLVKKRDRWRNFNLALFKAALVAECLPKPPTEEIKTWLESLRGEEPLLNLNQRRIMSAVFGLTGDPLTYAEASLPSVRTGREISGRRVGQIVTNSLRKLSGGYEALVRRAFVGPL